MLKQRGGNGAIGFFFKRYLQNSNKTFLGLLLCSCPYSNIALKFANLKYKTKDNCRDLRG